MKNKYVNYVSDEHFLHCIETLHKSYTKAHATFKKKELYKNKVDTIKLTFDSKFKNIDEESLIESEILRQIDKSINNFIGTFHENILGGIAGYEVGKKDSYDIKAKDNTLFADIKNKHNTTNSGSSESLYQKLKGFADNNKKAKCYWVQILAKSSFNENWIATINRKEYNHSRVYKISGDQFYALLSKEDDALAQLYKALPIAIKDYLDTVNVPASSNENSAIKELKGQIKKSKRTILDEITFESYGYFLGFDSL